MPQPATLTFASGDATLKGVRRTVGALVNLGGLAVLALELRHLLH